MIGRCRSGCSHSGVHGRVRYGDAMPPDNEVEVDTAESERIDALLRELDAEDLEFLEPPTSIWKAISATVDAERDAARIARAAPGPRWSSTAHPSARSWEGRTSAPCRCASPSPAGTPIPSSVTSSTRPDAPGS